jgi:hypothetical protein
MPLNGIVRELGLKRLMPDATAEVLSVVSGIVLILALTRWLFRIPASAANAQLAIQSILLVALTIGYEFAIGFAGGRSSSELLANYAIWEGRLWPLVLVALASTPWLWRGR